MKDRHVPLLRDMATEVNQVWNFCNDLSDRMIRERGHWMSGFDFSAYTAGASKEFEHIGSSTIQETSELYASKRRMAKRCKLKWRKSFGDKHSLGWVPFKARAASWKHGQVFFAGCHFKVWGVPPSDSYRLANYKFRAGCFTEDARGRWNFCVCVSFEPEMPKGQDKLGIDLGLKTVATCSDGSDLDGHWYRDMEADLARAQRARRKQRTKAILARIRNRRAHDMHDFSRKLVDRCGEITVGNVSSSKLTKTNMAKSTLDAGWASFRTMLEYRSQQAGIVYREINEKNTTRMCSECGSLSGPQGLRELSVRDWQCTTPPSVRFMGRIVYLGAIISLVSAHTDALNTEQRSRLIEVQNLAAQTLYRWRLWWSELVFSSACWCALSVWFSPPIPPVRQPGFARAL